MRIARIVTLVTVVGLLTALATACGGGDDNAAASAATTAAATAPATAPGTGTAPATPVPGTVTTGTGTTSTGGTAVTGGTTTLTLDSTVSDVLGTAGVEVGAAAPAEAQGAMVQFPVTGGTIGTAPLSGVIDHAGALRLSALGQDVQLARPQIDFDAGTLTAEVGGRRIPVFDLRTDGAAVTQAGGSTRIRGIAVTVGAQGAKAIGDALGVDVLRDGLRLGTLTVRAEG